MRIWTFILIALISCSSSTLLVFISRRFVESSVPIFILRLLGLGLVFWLLFDDDEHRAIYGTIGVGALAGWFLGGWDEIAFSLLYATFPPVFYLIIGLSGVLFLVYLYEKIKSLSSSR